MTKYESGGHHLWNSCGSEAGKDERKRAEGQVPKIREDGMGNQAGGTVKDGEPRGEPSKNGADARQRSEEEGTEEQRAE